MPKITVIGAGAWGIALALHAARAGADVTLCARALPQRDETGALSRLPGHPIPESIKLATQCSGGADFVLLTTPVQHLRGTLQSLAVSGPIIVCCKGVEATSLQLPLDVVREVVPERALGVLSGPNFAHEVADGLPAAAVLACKNMNIARQYADYLTTPAFRLYASADMTGVQIGGAAKNVIAIAAGITAGAGLGENARAALITRGIAEVSRLAQAMGGDPQTLGGLSGLGDLILTCTGVSSRNYSLGVSLGAGVPLVDILGARRSVTEGVATAPALVALAKQYGVSAPVIETVASLLIGSKTLDEARMALLSRPVGSE